MAHDPYDRHAYRNPREQLEPGEVPANHIRPGYSGGALVWIVVAVVLVLGGTILIGSRDASSPQATIQSGPQTTGSNAPAQ